MIETARITVTLTEPVAAGKRLRTDFVQDSYDHIPGTVLRGALAARWIAELGTEVTTSPEFLEVFESDGGFGPLHSELSVPTPLSVLVHKYRPDPGKCTRLWWDEAAGDDAPDDCEDCGKALERSKGEATGPVRRQHRTRAALTEQGVARPGQLFTQNSVAKGNRFSGWLHGPAVRALRVGAEPIDTLFLGGRTKLQGEARLEVDESAAAEPVEQYGSDLVLRLLGPGVFVDELGFPSAKPDSAELSEVLGVRAEVLGNRSWSRWCEVGGWHVASGLPKPMERAVQAGSTYRVRCSEPPGEQARRNLMARGIGLRRREGFGALYSFGSRPLTALQLVEQLAQLPESAEWQQHLPLLRARKDAMSRDSVDDTVFQQRIDVGDVYGRSLGTLLDIVDPDLFGEVLGRLEKDK